VSEQRVAYPATALCSGFRTALRYAPSRIIHLETFIVRHAMLIISSTPLHAVHKCAWCGSPIHPRQSTRNPPSQPPERGGLCDVAHGGICGEEGKL